MNYAIEFKSVGGAATIKDVDVKQGIITGYFSIFGNIDSDKDLIAPGAFKKSLSENYRRVKHLYQHDPTRPLSGTRNDRLKVKEDATGLYFESNISQTNYGKDVIQLYQDEVIDEHSIGFVTLRSADKKGYRELTEIKLFEGSTVTWGANEMAQTSSFKSMNKEQLITKADKLMKALRDGRYETEDAWDLLDLYFKQVQRALMETPAQPERAALPERKRNWGALSTLLTN
jgi:uncharacterized protein